MKTGKNRDERRDGAALAPSDELLCAALAPAVRAACGSDPSPAVLAAIRDQAARQPRRRRILFFTRVSYAAAAAFAALLTGFLALRPTPAARAERQARLLDDVLFLCDDGESAPVARTGDRERLAWRLLELQGLDAEVSPAPETPELPAPPSIDSQSRSMPAPREQICV
jgi:hypothetical protein